MNAGIHTEASLIKGLKKGKREYYELLYLKYNRSLYALCLRYVKDPDDAADILQEGFIRIFEKIAQFREEGSLEGWMKRIMVNEALAHLRKASPFFPVSDAKQAAVESEDINALDQLAAEDLHRLVSELPDGYRTVFNLYVVEGYSHREIADMLNISEGTSKSQLAKSRKELMSRIKKKGRSSHEYRLGS